MYAEKRLLLPLEQGQLLGTEAAEKQKGRSEERPEVDYQRKKLFRLLISKNRLFRFDVNLRSRSDEIR